MIHLLLPIPGRVELRHRKAVQVHQAGRVVDDQADGNAGTGVDDLHVAGVGWSGSRLLGDGRRKANAGAEGGDTADGVLDEFAAGYD
ncbi:MAG TPA: hypothetical protein DCY13_18125 [Verrucomicrobiales bacterium]|nr:hypothetical protein [Verrucomicrobiales bacterium]